MIKIKVPEIYQVQMPDIANPPTFFLLVRSMLERIENNRNSKESKLVEDFLQQAFPRLKAHYQYLMETQFGITKDSFRWRGGTENHTLASGLDDYPRAKVPSERELHLDLHCWMTFSAQIMTKLAKFLGKPFDTFEETHQRLLKRLDGLKNFFISFHFIRLIPKTHLFIFFYKKSLIFFLFK